MIETINSVAAFLPSQVETLNQQFAHQSTDDLLAWSLSQFGDKLAMATGFGISGIVLMHMISKLQPKTTVFYLQTDLLFPETMKLKDELAERLDIEFTEVHSGLRLDHQALQYGPSLWRTDPDLCCHLRKVEPLRQFLSGKEAWITGLRRDQSASRANIEKISWDGTNQLMKLAPLADWSREDVWDYIQIHELPYNALHDKGYPSLGCTVCTRKVLAGAKERDGRWADQEKTECGIHIQPDGKIVRANQ